MFAFVTTLGSHFSTWGSMLELLGVHVCRFVILLVCLGLNFEIFGLQLGTLGSHFNILSRLWPGPWAWRLLGKSRETCRKIIEKESPNGCMFFGFQVFCVNGVVIAQARTDLFGAFLLFLFAFTCPSPFLIVPEPGLPWGSHG